MLINKLSEGQTEYLSKKFKSFDLLYEHRKPAIGYMKSDPSLFAYFNFTDPKDINKPFTGYPVQDLVLNNNDSKRLCLIIARQTGKSTIAALDALHTAYYNPNSLVLVISSTKDQAKELIHRMQVFLTTSRWTTFNIGGTTKDSKTEIRLKNPSKKTWSRIISVPATDAARGYSPQVVILDEADFIENAEYFIPHVVLPMVQNTKGKIKIYTTPNPHKRTSFVKKTISSGVWDVYQFGWRANPDTTEEEIEEVKKSMSPSEFNVEYEANFPTTESSFFKESLVQDAQNPDCGLGGSLPKDTWLACGVDFAKIHDKSIFYIGYIENPNDSPNEHIINVWRRIVKPIGTDYTGVLAEVRNLRDKANVAKFIIDATGVGEVPADILKRDGIPCEPIKFNLQSKADMFGNLQLLFEQKRIKIPMARELFDQLVFMEHEYIGYNKLKIHHPPGGHDDEVDALALMAWGLSRSYKPAGLKIIKHNVKSNEPDFSMKTHLCSKCEEDFKAKAKKHFMPNLLCPRCE